MEGGRKWHKILSLSPKSVESYRPAVGSNEAAVGGPGTADGFPTLVN